MTKELAVVVPVFNEPEICRTLDGLYNQQLIEGVHHYLVDNASTDDTRARVEVFLKEHDDFPLTIIEEEQKGTGTASATGFERAIEDGFPVVSRTDGDTEPNTSWTLHTRRNFDFDNQLQLLGGKSRALRDKYYRRGDDLLLGVAIQGARISMALTHLDKHYLKAVIGHNMATRAAAYEDVGGLAHSSLMELDEDIDYSLKIAERFGVDSIKIDPELVVATSMRRIRAYGVAGTAIHHLFPSTRKQHKDSIDIR